MVRTGLIIGAVALLAAGGAATFLPTGGGERQTVIAADATAESDKNGARLDGAPREGRAPVRHVLPNFKWFGERDESRLASRPIGSYSEVIETDDGVILILDHSDNVVLERDPSTASTTIADGYQIPAVTPRQLYASPDEIDLKVYEPPMTIAGDLPGSGGTAKKGDRLSGSAIR